MKRHIRLELKLEDLWIGAFWRKSPERFDLWICLLPCLPIHYWQEHISEEIPTLEEVARHNAQRMIERTKKDLQR